MSGTNEKYMEKLYDEYENIQLQSSLWINIFQLEQFVNISMTKYVETLRRWQTP